MLPFEGSDLPINRLEQEVNTAPQTSNLVLILQEVISTSEELGSCYDILCESIVSTELPTLKRIEAFCTSLVVIGCTEGSQRGKLAICYISTPGTLVSCVSTLVAYLYVVGILVAIVIRILPIACMSIVERSLYILVKCIGNACINNLEVITAWSYVKI